MFNATSPVNGGTAAVTAVDGLYEEDAAIVPAVEPADQADISKPEDGSIQALSNALLHSCHGLDNRTCCNCMHLCAIVM